MWLSPMISEGMIYVKGLGAYSGAMVYALYPSRSMLEGLQNLGWRYWLEGLARWFVKAIRSSSFLYKIATSSMPFPLPRIKFGEEGRKGILSLWARTLDDLVICKARAYYNIRERVEGIFRGAPHIRIRTSDESLNIEKSSLIDLLRRELTDIAILSKVEPILETRVGSVILRGRPDLYLMANIGKVIRGLIIELHETDFNAIKKTWHVLPRLYVYALASYMRYGITPISFSIPLSIGEKLAVLCLANTTGKLANQVKEIRIGLPHISTLLSELSYISTLDRPPRPYSKSKIFCKECRYRTICEF